HASILSEPGSADRAESEEAEHWGKPRKAADSSPKAPKAPSMEKNFLKSPVRACDNIAPCSHSQHLPAQLLVATRGIHQWRRAPAGKATFASVSSPCQ